MVWEGFTQDISHRSDSCTVGEQTQGGECTRRPTLLPSQPYIRLRPQVLSLQCQGELEPYPCQNLRKNACLMLLWGGVERNPFREMGSPGWSHCIWNPLSHHLWGQWDKTSSQEFYLKQSFIDGPWFPWMVVPAGAWPWWTQILFGGN